MNTSKHPRISDTEWEIMRIVWARQPVTAADIIVELTRQDATWHPMTAKTLLNRLVKKGVLVFHVDGRAYVYRAVLGERECITAVTDQFLDRVFGGSAAALLTHMARERRLTPREIRELRTLPGLAKDE